MQYYYHGTSLKRLPDILGMGLVPSEIHNKTVTYPTMSKRQKIYLTTLDDALMWANWVASDDKSSPVILRIPTDEIKDKTPDTFFNRAWTIESLDKVFSPSIEYKIYRDSYDGEHVSDWTPLIFYGTAQPALPTIPEMQGRPRQTNSYRLDERHFDKVRNAIDRAYRGKTLSEAGLEAS